MNQYQFRLAVPADAPAVERVYQSLVGQPGCTWHADYPTIEHALDDIRVESLYLLLDNDKIIAVASAGPFDDIDNFFAVPELAANLKNPCALARIGVIKDKQNQGIAKLVLDKVIESCQRRGYDSMVLLVSPTNPAALKLYQSRGFKKCAENIFIYGHDYARYALCLNSAQGGGGAEMSSFDSRLQASQRSDNDR